MTLMTPTNESIGEPRRTVIIEPATVPQSVPEPVRLPEREPEQVPA